MEEQHYKTEKWIDVSATIFDGMVRWPTDPAVHIYKAEEIGKDGAEANVTGISTTAHVGTHVDAPLHFYKDGADVASIGLDKLVGHARVIEIKDKEKISLEEIKDIPIEKGDRILFRTRNSDADWTNKPFTEDYVYLSTEAANYLVSKEVNCIGVDYLSLGSKENDPEVHRAVLGASIVIIEGLVLKDILAGEYEMICLPLKIKDSDGGPARVIIRKI
ncbi:MAG: cyclase family protein [Bacteroidetes bacterium]|nr:cyclase family protein [Bacteroidota bacterium]